MTLVQSIPNPASTKIALVIQDIIQGNFLCDLLKKAGLESIPYNSAESALEGMSLEAPPALIITDLAMPGIDGWRFCRLLRSPEYVQFNHIPVLVVSATFTGDETARIASDVGANAFLAMPVDGQEFINQISTLLKGEKPETAPRVLIIENDLLATEKIGRAFHAHGYRVDAAYTYRDGLNRIEQTAYDIAVLNNNVQDGMGDFLLKDLLKKYPECVCIMLTTEQRPELALSWMKIGAAAYLQKPFDPEYLVAQCERARRERALLRVQNLLDLRTRQLQLSEEKYRSLVQYASDPIFAFNPDETYRYVNDALAKVFGKKPEEIIGKTPYSILPPDEAKKRLELVRQVFQTGESGEVEGKVINFLGEERIFSTHADPVTDKDGKVLYVTCTSRDITRLKLAEKALQESNYNLNKSQEIANIGNWSWDLSTNLFSASAEGLKLLGFSPDCQPTFEEVRERIHPDDIPTAHAALEGLLQTGIPYSIETRIFKKDSGELRHILSKAEIEKDSAGKQINIFGVNLDITHRKQIEDALRASEQNFRDIFNSTGEAIIISDPQHGQIIDVNDSMLKMYNFESKAEALCCNIGDLSANDPLFTNQRALDLGNKAIAEGPQVFEWLAKRKDGTTFWCEISLCGSQIGGKFRILAFIRDISMRKQAEQKINEQIAELRRWNTTALSRENRILQLKSEVNNLLIEAGLPPRYASAKEP